jgi:acetoin utilization deacetylase AcuC-like enzyme
MKPLLLTHPDCLHHEMPGHPERPARLSAVMDELARSGISADMREILASEIDDEDVLRVHPKTYLKHIEASEPVTSVIKVDPDTYMSPGSTRAAKLAAGAVAEATTRVLNGEANRAFCAIRPPGHHAEIASAYGFCLFNSVAIAAELALQRPDIHRVAICDFDVHHCNGTVDIFKDRPEVLVCSSFQNHFYPHRYLDFCNDHIICTPLESGTNSKTFRTLIERDWIPNIEKHKPDLIFVSAGFDAHEADPLAEICLQDDDFRWISRLLADLSNQYSKGRLISALEGGYELDALARSAKLHVETIIGTS